MSIRGRMVLVVLIAVAVGALTSTWLGQRVVDRTFEASLIAGIEREVRLVAAGISARPVDLTIAAHRYGTLLGRRISIIDANGRVLGDSEFDEASLQLLENHLGRPEVQAALTDGVGVARRVSASTNREELKVAVAAWPGVVRVSVPTEVLLGPVPSVAGTTVRGALVGLAVGLALAVFLQRRMFRAFREGTDAIQGAASGGMLPVRTSGVPELDRLLLSTRVYAQTVDARMATLMREHTQTRTVIDGMGEGILAADASGRVVQANRSAREFLGLDQAGELGNLTELFYEREARAVVDAVVQGKSESGREVELRGRAVVMTARPLPDAGLVLGLFDMTDARKLQAVRRDFVANVSHELKTPLTSILGYAETLLQDDVAKSDRQEFVRVIRDNAERMRHLVENLLNLARVESGAWTPKCERINGGAVVREAWAALGDRPHTAGVRLDQPAEEWDVFADRDAFQMVLTNLIDNAVRHSPAGGVVSVSATAESGQTVIQVSDTGSGIAREHVPRLFERFYRVDPGRSRAEGGTGLGLSIVRHLVEGHGGRIVLESELGRGTSVRMTFPN